MGVLQGLAPIENPQARVLILGSMPGDASLKAARYYAHPRNLFWTFMGELVGASTALPYEARIERLREAGIALWDVIARCERQGSLDSAIRGEEANDFASFFGAHPRLRRILFNGAKAEATFARQVPPALLPPDVVCQRLPSTSPANQFQPVASKLEAWRAALQAGGIELTGPSGSGAPSPAPSASAHDN